MLELLRAGSPIARLADVLEVSPDTVKYHLKNIFAKLQVVDRRAAVQAAPASSACWTAGGQPFLSATARVGRPTYP